MAQRDEDVFYERGLWYFYDMYWVKCGPFVDKKAAEEIMDIIWDMDEAAGIELELE